MILYMTPASGAKALGRPRDWHAAFIKDLEGLARFWRTSAGNSHTLFDLFQQMWHIVSGEEKSLIP